VDKKLHRYSKIVSHMWQIHRIRLLIFNMGLQPDSYGLGDELINCWFLAITCQPLMPDGHSGALKCAYSLSIF